MRKSLLPLLLGLAFAGAFPPIGVGTASAQKSFVPGYVITLAGDTLIGWVADQARSSQAKQCLFKPSESASVQPFLPDEIAGYGLGKSKLYLARPLADSLPQERAFFECLLLGKVSLFRFKRAHYLEDDTGKLTRFVIEEEEFKPGGIRFVRPTNTHIIFLTELLGACGTMKAGLMSGEIPVKERQRYLMSLLEQYHQCLGAPYQIFQEEGPWFDWRVGVVAMATWINMDLEQRGFQALFEEQMENPLFFPVGIQVALFSPRILGPDVSFQTGMWYQHSQYASFSENQETGGVIRYDLSLWVKKLIVPAGFKYTFTQNPLQPFLAAGVSAHFKLAGDSQVIREDEFNGQVMTSTSRPFTIQRQFGLWGEAGLTLLDTKPIDFQVVLRYENHGSLIDKSLALAQMRGDAFSIGASLWFP